MPIFSNPTMLLAPAGLVLAAFAALALSRYLDARTAEQARRDLAAAMAGPAATFEPAMLEGLPEPAQRYFLYMIRPGARLATAAAIEMGGEIGLGPKEAPGCQPMRARQILAAPLGFVWEVEAGSGVRRFCGSDAMVGDRSWSRFRLLGLLPIARTGGTADHLRSSFGRVVGEAAMWTPAALLPGLGVRWSLVDADTARATVEHRGLIQTVDIRVAADGRPLWVVLPRWSNANPERRWREQPFGGTLDAFREVEGFNVPMRVDGGNHFGTEDYFPFYKARVTAIRFIGAGAEP